MMNVTEHENSLTAAAEREFVRDVKEKLRYFGADYDTVHQSTAQMDKEKTLRASTKKLHHRRRRTFSLRRSFAPARIHWRMSHWNPRHFSVEQHEMRRLRPHKLKTPLRQFRSRHGAHIESYELSDGNIIIRFRCAEASFKPISRATRFHDVLFLELDAVVLSSGTTMFFKGFLSALLPSTMKIKVFASPV